MDTETIRTIATSIITATSTLGAASIAAYFGYRTQRLSVDTNKLNQVVEQRNRELIKAYQHISAYYQLEQIYSEELSTKTNEAQKTIKSRIRKTVEDKGFNRPEWTSTECNQEIARLET
jgi:hypothetical protein